MDSKLTAMDYRNLKPEDFVHKTTESTVFAVPLELIKRAETRAFIFKNTQGGLVCLLETENQTEKLPKIRGVDISYQEYGQPNQNKDLFIQLICRNSAYSEIFTRIIPDILNDYDNSDRVMSLSLNRVFQKWKAFLADMQKRKLSEEDITGLIGELLFLGKLWEKCGSEALRFWVADEGGNDFVSETTLAEIKATTRGKHQHVINGIDQLLDSPGKQKFIVSLIFARNAGETGLCLPDLVQHFEALLTEEFEKTEIFFKNLANRGYDPTAADEYSEYYYSLIRGAFFRVDENLPRLTTGELKRPLDSRISKVRYTLDLEGLSCVDFNDENTNKIFG